MNNKITMGMLIPWIIIIVLIFLLWFFLGGKKTEFLGLQPFYHQKRTAYDPFSPGFVDKYYELHNAEASPTEQQTSPQSPTDTSEQSPIIPSGSIHASLSAFEKANKDHYTIPAVGTDIKVLRGSSDAIVKWKTENDCCLILQDIYGKPFKTVRPSWLRNPETNGILELDCYNEDLKLAVEYNGVQHYVYPNPFHKSYDEFIAQVRRDQYKVNKCDQLGVYLITIPYTIPRNKLREYITHYLPENVKCKHKCKFESKVCMA